MLATKRELEAVLATFTLFTTLPVTLRRGSDAGNVNYAILPIVGLALGACLFGVDQLARLVLPDAPATALVVVALVGLTGAIHLDGLADSADGLFGARDREGRLAIMDDPRNGAFGLVAIGCVLLLKFGALLSLEGSLRGWVIILFPCLSRSSVLLLMPSFPAARPAGLGAGALAATGALSIVAGSLLALAAAFLALGPPALVLVAVGAITALGAGAYASSRIGGVTGDVLGAGIELAEAAILLAAATSVEGDWLV